MALNVPAPVKHTALQNIPIWTSEPKYVGKGISAQIEVGRTGSVPTEKYTLKKDDGSIIGSQDSSKSEAVRELVKQGVDRQEAFNCLEALSVKGREAQWKAMVDQTTK